MSESLTEQPRVAVIGMGRIGGVHVQAWRQCRDVHLAAVCDVDEKALERARPDGLKTFTNVGKMLEAVQPDIVSICTPPASHPDLAAYCLERGLHVLCEKPLTTSLKSARQLTELSSRTPGNLLVASKFRHVPAIAEARAALRAGEIGSVKDFRIEFAAPVAMADLWYSVPAVSGGGVIIDNGWHAFDLVHFLFGGIEDVRARLGKAPQGLSVEETAVITVTAAGGETGEIGLSWSAKSSGSDYVIVSGDRGTLRVNWQTYDKNVAHARMMESFRDVVTGRGQPWISVEEMLGTAASVDAAYRSIQSDASVPVQRLTSAA
jgi:predicted dehydrogenase